MAPSNKQHGVLHPYCIKTAVHAISKYEVIFCLKNRTLHYISYLGIVVLGDAPGNLVVTRTSILRAP